MKHITHDAPRRAPKRPAGPPPGDAADLAFRCTQWLIHCRQEAWGAAEEWAVGPDKSAMRSKLGTLRALWVAAHVAPSQRAEVTAQVNLGIFG